MHDSICEKKDYFYLFYKYSDLTLQTFINRLNNRKINEDTIDMKQIEISKYSLIGKEIASKDPSINGSLLKKLKEKNDKTFKSYNQFLNVIKSKSHILYNEK